MCQREWHLEQDDPIAGWNVPTPERRQDGLRAERKGVAKLGARFLHGPTIGVGAGNQKDQRRNSGGFLLGLRRADLALHVAKAGDCLHGGASRAPSNQCVEGTLITGCNEDFKPPRQRWVALSSEPVEQLYLARIPEDGASGKRANAEVEPDGRRKPCELNDPHVRHPSTLHGSDPGTGAPERHGKIGLVGARHETVLMDVVQGGRELTARSAFRLRDAIPAADHGAIMPVSDYLPVTSRLPVGAPSGLAQR